MTDDDKALVDRLRATWTREYHPTPPSSAVTGNLSGIPILAEQRLFNPDGPEAAARIEAQAAEIERLTFELAVASEPSPYCPICGSCGIAGCCGPKRCLYPTTDQDDQIETLEAEIEKLREALREVFEEWAGSEGFIPETAPEGYLLHLTKRMADIARAALGETK